MSETVDVVVVGAGLSGLIAARELEKAGVAVLVLEAADRCGGRAYAVTSTLGSRLDLGGQWIGHDHHRLAALADELGATRFGMHTSFMPLVTDGKRRVRLYSPTLWSAVGYLCLLNLLRATRRPARWGRVSVQDWLRKVPKRTRRLLEVVALISWTADLERISIRTAMSLISKQGGLMTMLSTKGGAQEGLVVEGVGTLVERIAEELGDAVRTGTPVTKVVRDADGVVVSTTSGDVRAREVVVAVPPPRAARIAHEPPLPAARAALERQTFMGSIYKAVAVYPTPYWRATSSGELLLLGDPGCAVFDGSAPGGPGHLVLLVGGPEAHSLDELTREDRRARLLGAVAEHLGPQALEPVDWHEKSWHLDPCAGGGYVAVPDLGADVATLPMSSAPLERLHWAGSETDDEHPGYLDGAIGAGHRAAAEVIGALAKPGLGGRDVS